MVEGSFEESCGRGIVGAWGRGGVGAWGRGGVSACRRIGVLECWSVGVRGMCCKIDFLDLTTRQEPSLSVSSSLSFSIG
jgi:hypothetical protein